MKYHIDQDMNIDYQDEGPWRSYQLSGEGDTLAEFMSSLAVSEIDEDGAELGTTDLIGMGPSFYRVALEMLSKGGMNNE